MKILFRQPKQTLYIFFGLFFYFLLPWVCYALIVVFCVTSLSWPGLFLAALLVTVLEFLRKIFFSAHLGNTFSGRGGHSGGGFGGGGGGSFGGGGASGRW